jgi:hypothetical protein
VQLLAWLGTDNLLRQVGYEGLREDKPTREVRCEVAHANPPGAAFGHSPLFCQAFLGILAAAGAG